MIQPFQSRTKRMRGATPPADRPVNHRLLAGVGTVQSLRAVRLVAVAFLLLDLADGVIRLAVGGGWGPADTPVALLQSGVVVLATMAALWWRRWLIVAAGGPLLVTSFVTMSGLELWFFLAAVLIMAMRLNRAELREPPVWLIGCIVAGYLPAFGLAAERNGSGGFWFGVAIAAVLAVAAAAVGAICRYLVWVRDGKRREVARKQRELAGIRATERKRLAGELSEIVIAQLDETAATVRAHHADDAIDSLHRWLATIDQQNRSTLTRLRDLLGILRDVDDDAPTGFTGGRARRPHGWVDVLSARHVRLAGILGLALLTLRALLSDRIDLVEVTCLITATVAFRSPRIAAWLGLAAAVAAVLTGEPGYSGAVGLGLSCLFATLQPRRFDLPVLAVVLPALVLATDQAAVLRPAVAAMFVAALVGALTGLAARHFLDSRNLAVRQLQRLEHEQDRILRDERDALARELHDVVAHQLSLVNLRVMAAQCSDDAEVLRTALTEIDRATRTARTELDVLLAAMRAPISDASRSGPLTSPSVTASTFRQLLADNGFHAVLDIDQRADTVDPLTVRTLTRLLQEATTNILRYAPAGATCHYRLRIEPDLAHLSITNPMPVDSSAGSTAWSSGFGLRGLQERVTLSGGTFSAGPELGLWCVRASLPLTLPLTAEDPPVPDPAIEGLGSDDPRPGSARTHAGRRAHRLVRRPA